MYLKTSNTVKALLHIQQAAEEALTQEQGKLLLMNAQMMTLSLLSQSKSSFKRFIFVKYKQHVLKIMNIRNLDYFCHNRGQKVHLFKQTQRKDSATPASFPIVKAECEECYLHYKVPVEPNEMQAEL